MIWTAGFVTSDAVRDQFVSAVRKYAAVGKNTQAFGDLYETADGAQGPHNFRARPVVGGHLALVCSNDHRPVQPTWSWYKCTWD